MNRTNDLSISTKPLYLIKFNNGKFWGAQRGTVTDKFYLAKTYTRVFNAKQVAEALIKRRHKWYPYNGFSQEVTGYEIVEVQVTLNPKVVVKVDNVE